MSRLNEYREKLKSLDDWIPYLKQNSGLPGPRGNLELAHAVAQEGKKKQFEHLLSIQAEENTPEVFLVFCGVMGLAKLAGHDPKLFDRLRGYASDPRWRIREALATGLQLVGDEDISLLIREMQTWSKGNWLEKRAAAAALAEPRLLKDPKVVSRVLLLFDTITSEMEAAHSPAEEAFKVLRQAMGYCWSVAIAAYPDEGKPMMEKWITSQNKDIQWVMKENLRKNRLVRMDANWVRDCLKRL